MYEWNQYAAGAKALKKLLTHKDKEVAESAGKLRDAVKAEAGTWVAEAEAAGDADPVTAYDLYAKTVAALPKEDELAKTADAAMKKLKSNEAVKAELDARKMYDKMLNAMSIASPSQRGDVARFAEGIVKKYPDTPTGKRAAELAKELG